MERAERPMNVRAFLPRNMKDKTLVLLLKTKFTEQKRVTQTYVVKCAALLCVPGSEIIVI
jgi:hypothetical protein